MNLKFSTKLFFTFLLFGTTIIFSLGYFEYKMIKEKVEENSIKTFYSNIDDIDSKIKKIKIENKKIIDSIKNLNSIESMDNIKLLNYLKAIIDSHMNILEISILDKSYNVLINTSNNKSFENEDFYKYLSSLNKNELYISEIDLKSINKDIVYPLVNILKIAKKVDNYIIVLDININNLIDSFKSFSYVLDKKNNIIFDKTNKYTWSKYYYPNINLENELPFLNKIIHKKEMLLHSEYIYKFLKIDKDNYLIILNSFEKLDLNEFINLYLYEILTIAILTLIISLILSLLLTVPISKINKKLLTEKDSLYNSIKKKSLELDESLEIIDQHVMFLKMSKNYVIEDVSSYFCEVYGYQKEELLGQHYSILYSKDRYKQIKKEVFDRLAEINEWKGEILAKKKDGEEYWVESYIKADFEGPNLKSYTIIRKDISDNKKVEKLYEDLYYQIEQLNVIFQNVYSGISLIDIKGNIKKSNLFFCNILGYTNDEITSINIFDLISIRNKNLLEKILKDLNEFGSISDMEFIFITKNETEIYLNLSLKILPDKANVVVVVNSLEDKRKLQELNQNLEQRVKEEVTKNIQKDKAHQEERLKNVKLTSIGTLAAGITHEINTPLTYLKGNFEMLQMDIDDVSDENLKNEMVESCTKISDAITRISVIVESMREMSQTSSEVKEKTNVFSSLITSLTMAYNVSKQISKIFLNDKEFKLTNIKKDEMEFFAKIQKQRLEQVWVIIVNNALDELKKIESYEDRRLDIKIYEEEDFIVIKFIDNAGGIKKEILAKIFEPFISSKEHSGMGIGLNIAKKIVDEQEGIMEAYNQDAGAVFEIKLQKAKS
ncbi:PAS domain S-box protein [Halarcobacter sp.]|uniref:PAS domain-containing sensor histidine kinase n=1 Tax=Halarcobacter sp. TaxID=2321133 RepID=UPI0029F4EF7E|nr:PAS domain S-box protein [Halarcobacter sp.]